MVVLHNEIWLKKSKNEAYENLQKVTQKTTFGPLGMIDAQLEYNNDWLGEIDSNTLGLKLYRVDDKDLSDFYIKGKLLKKGSAQVLSYTINTPWTFLFGIAGFTGVPVCITYLLVLKKYLSNPLWVFGVGVVFIAYFFIKKYKDYIKTESLFREIFE